VHIKWCSPYRIHHIGHLSLSKNGNIQISNLNFEVWTSSCDHGPSLLFFECVALLKTARFTAGINIKLWRHFNFVLLISAQTWPIFHFFSVRVHLRLMPERLLWLKHGGSPQAFQNYLTVVFIDQKKNISFLCWRCSLPSQSPCFLVQLIFSSVLYLMG